MKKILSLGIISLALLIPVLYSEAANTNKPAVQPIQAKLENLANITQNRIERIENINERASSTQFRLEDRQEIMNQMRNRIASTTQARMEKMDDRFEQQRVKMNQARERLMNRELRVVEVLQKISDKIATRINILVEKNLDLSLAEGNLTEANNMITELTVQAEKLTSLLETEITDENKTEITDNIRTEQTVLRNLAKEVHALLVDAIKEVAKINL